MQTILESGDRAAFNDAIADAFAGAWVEVTSVHGAFEMLFHQKGMLRPLQIAELSDGTLRYVLLAAALLSPRPPELMVLNEPETSLHPDLLAPLGRLVAGASAHTQIIVVTHAPPLVATLGEVATTRLFVLDRQWGETLVQGDDAPSWTWPSR